MTALTFVHPEVISKESIQVTMLDDIRQQLFDLNSNLIDLVDAVKSINRELK